MSPRQSVVVAGGIGSGKSTVIAALSQLGWSVINADLVGHEVLTDPDIVEGVRKRWPETVVGTEVVRSRLASIVFSTPEALTALESLTHPGIVGRIDAWVEATSGPKAIEVSVLKVDRPGWGPIVMVHAPAGLRLQRALERGMDAADAKTRMASQPPDTELLAAADFVIDNQGTVANLKQMVGRFDRWVRS